MATSFDLIVSIVTYNPNITYLQQTLNSLSRTKLKIKVLLHDNSPIKDNLSLSSHHPLAYFHDGKNLGYGGGHNENISKGVHEAPYFLILNPDIYFDNNLLPQLISRLENDKSIGLTIPKILSPNGDLQRINRRLPHFINYLASFLEGKFGLKSPNLIRHELYLLKDIDLSRPFICPTISGCFMLFRSSILKELGGFDPRYFLYFEDTDLSRRASKISKTVVFSDLYAFHHWGRGAYGSPRLFLLFLRSMVRYFNKWGWFMDKERAELNANVSYY